MDLLDLEPGDLVVINDRLHSTYVIKRIKEKEIELIDHTTSKIIYDFNKQQWILKRLGETYPVLHFQKRPLDYSTMLQLPDRELVDICRYDITSICDDEIFWMERIHQQYGDLILKYKPTSETYKQQYHMIKDYIDRFFIYANTSINRVDLVLATVIYNPNQPSHELLEFLMTIEDIDLWNDIKKQIIDVLSSFRAGSVYEYLQYKLKSSQLLYWLLSQEEITKNVEILTQIANFAARQGDLNILNIIAGYGIYPSHVGIITAINNKHLNIFQWMINNNLIDASIIKYLTKREINRNIYYSYEIVEMYEILYEHDLLNENDLNNIREWAMQENQYDILTWVDTLYRRP